MHELWFIFLEMTHTAVLKWKSGHQNHFLDVLKQSLPTINKCLFWFWVNRSCRAGRWSHLWLPSRRTCRSQAGGCYLSAQLTLGKPQHWLPQHKQFVESNRKLHEVVTLSVHFPGISLYICENEKRNGRCADAEVFAAGLRAAWECTHLLSAPSS